MSAARALGGGKDMQPRPAKAANQPPLDPLHRPLTRDTHTREQKVEGSSGVFAYPVAWSRSSQTSDFRIASRSGSNPNQRWKDSAPCSMSIGKPSAARFPWARAALTHGVPPRR